MSASKIRPAFFADRVYPANPEILAEVLKQVTPSVALYPDRTLRVLHVPHIDYLRGIEIYGAGYQSLRQQEYDLIFLLGTSHQYGQSFAIFTDEDFDSPFGPVRNALESTNRLIDGYGRARALSEQILHRTEHSLELQIPFVKHIAPSTPIVPILLGSLHHLFPTVDRFSYEPYRRCVEVLVEETQRLDKEGKKYLFLAGVDMAHVGRFFGDDVSLTNERLHTISVLDKEYLEFIESLDGDLLYNHIASDNDNRRVCGFSTMMIITDVLKARGEQRLEALNACYKPCFDPATDCCVTIGGVGYYSV